MDSVGQLANELGAPERTLRRAVREGTVHSRRLSERRLRVAPEELEYLRGHWPLLASLREALRTEPSVRTAILAGSMARGDERADSDVDLVVALDSELALDRTRLAMRLSRKLGRDVDVASLDLVAGDPLSLLQLVDEGRVIVDRRGIWPKLRTGRPATRKRAERAYLRQQRKLVALSERHSQPR
jgi:predicted nucleotidyltransferase